MTGSGEWLDRGACCPYECIASAEDKPCRRESSWCIRFLMLCSRLIDTNTQSTAGRARKDDSKGATKLRMRIQVGATERGGGGRACCHRNWAANRALSRILLSRNPCFPRAIFSRTMPTSRLPLSLLVPLGACLPRPSHPANAANVSHTPAGNTHQTGSRFHAHPAMGLETVLGDSKRARCHVACRG